MSVKKKVKRLNEQIELLNNVIGEMQAENVALMFREDKKRILLENIIKFAIRNHIGNLHGGMSINCIKVDMMSILKLDIERIPEEDCYVIGIL